MACTSADSHAEATAHEAGSAAEIEATRKMAKYTDMPSQFVFHTIAVETQAQCPLNESARDLFSDVGRCIAMCSGDDRESSFLFQRVSVVEQRFHSRHDSFCVDDQPD